MVDKLANSRWFFLLLVLMLVAASWAFLIANNGGDGEGDRGDDPLVGSLPSLVSPDPDIMFWLPLGGTWQDPNNVQDQRVTLGFIGESELNGNLLDAEGDPYGKVNAREDWDCFGLTNNGFVWLARGPALSTEPDLWLWVPKGFLGGNIHFETPLGNSDTTILGNTFQLPLAQVAAQPVGSMATVTVTPHPINQSLGEKEIVFVVHPTTIEVIYTLL